MTSRTVPVFYSSDYVFAGHAFDTTRKARWVAESLEKRPIPGIVIEEPEPLGQRELEAVHDAAYVDAVRTGEPRHLVESNGFGWDAGLWTMTCASTGPATASCVGATGVSMVGTASP